MIKKGKSSHILIQERMQVEKGMWFERAQMLVDLLVYVKKATSNLETMCITFARICEFSTDIDPKIKLYKEANGFLEMYNQHNLEYHMFEIHSAEAFQSFVV